MKDFFRGKRILITGNTGFKGVWLTILLQELGAEVTGISRPQDNEDSFFARIGLESRIKQYYFDIENYAKLEETVKAQRPDIIFHLAAQSITFDAYRNPLETFRVNGIGTANILEALRHYTGKCLAILITSDKCYRNNEWPWGYRENDTLAGLDPYSASKSVAEIIVNSYNHSFFKDDDRIKLSTCRAGNVIGGGDWNPYRIVPDCIRAWQEGQPLEIRHPEAIRPWNYVLDVLYGYMKVACELENGDISGESFNFGPLPQNEISVLELVKRLWKSWPDKSFEPYTILDQNNNFFEHRYLKLNSDKAMQMLKWNPKVDIDDAMDLIAKYYASYLDCDVDAYALSVKYVKQFLER